MCVHVGCVSVCVSVCECVCECVYVESGNRGEGGVGGVCVHGEEVHMHGLPSFPDC